MLKLCLIESDIPETKQYGEEVLRENGMVSGNKHAMINYLQKRHNYRLKDFAKKNEFLIIGAYVEQCIGWLAIAMFEQYDAKGIAIDISRSFSLLEKYKFMQDRTILSTTERMDLLWQNHPELHPYEHKLILQK